MGGGRGREEWDVQVQGQYSGTVELTGLEPGNRYRARVASSTDNVQVGRFSEDFIFSTAEREPEEATEMETEATEEISEDENSDSGDAVEAEQVTHSIPSIPASDVAVKPSPEEVDVREAEDDTAKKDASESDSVEESNGDAAAQQQSLKTGGGTSPILSASLFILTLILVSIEC